MKLIRFPSEEEIVAADEINEHDLVVVNNDEERHFGVLGVRKGVYVFWEPYQESELYIANPGESLYDFMHRSYTEQVGNELLFFASGRELIDWMIRRG